MKKTALAVLPWLLLLASPAPAVDGMLEINQTCADGGGCFAGDTPGFPVQITAPGSYVLTSDLVTPANAFAGIFATASAVSIDLNGFSIRGNMTCFGSSFSGSVFCVGLGFGGIGIRANGHSQTVRNGSIIGMHNGGINVGDNSLVEDVHLSHNGGTAIRVGHSSIVRGNTIRMNAGTRFGEDVVAGVQADHSVVIDNAINAVHGTAIHARDSRVAGNVIVAVDGDAVDLLSGIMVGNVVAVATGLGLRAGQSTGIGGNVFRANNSFGDQFCNGQEISTNVVVGSASPTCP